MNLINATPHAISILGNDGHPLLTLPASGLVLRCATAEEPAAPLEVGGPTPPGPDAPAHVWEAWGVIATVPTVRTVYGEVQAVRDGLPCPVPAPQPDVVYVVSALVRLAAPERPDLLSPGPLVRDAQGQPTGCKGLTRT